MCLQMDCISVMQHSMSGACQHHAGTLYTVRTVITHQGVVVLDLLHGRLGRQGKLDDLEVV